MEPKLGPFRVEYLRIAEHPKRIANLLNPPHRFDVAVAGISYRQGAVRKALQRGSKGMAELFYDNFNEHDPNAIAVFVRDFHVGYLPRALAKQFREAMKSCTPKDMLWIPLRCPMVIIGGGVDRNYGIRLDLPRSSTQVKRAKLSKGESKFRATRKANRVRLKLSDDILS